MKLPDSHPEFTRRQFIKTSAGFAAAAAVAPASLSSAQTAAEKPAAKKMIGIQAGTVSFVDEGVEQALDIFQEKGAINAVYLATYTYDRGLDGRGQPLPDHGKQESDARNYHGGDYATPHAEFYHNTILKPERAPDFGDLDIVATLLPPMNKRGMKLFCSIQDSFTYRENSPGMQNLTEVDLQGNRTRTLCLCHPDVRAFWPALATDLCKSYDIDGIAFFNEHNGPLLNAIGASHAQRIDSSRVTCFCEFHQKAARASGISIDRAKEGYRTLDRFVKNSLADKRPSDGYFVEFWRLLVEYPEIIAWDKLFDQGKHQVLADVYAAVKSVRKELQVAFHIEHVNSFNPIFRATRSYADLATKADLLKVVVYNNCGGGRYASFIRNINSTVFRDVSREELLQFNNIS